MRRRSEKTQGIGRETGPAKALRRAKEATGATAAHLRDRYGALLRNRKEDAFRAAVRHTRPLVFAEALVVLVLGFTSDDLHVLRVPGFVVGALLAILILGLAGILHGASLTARLRGIPEPLRTARLARYRSVGRALLFLAVLGTVSWLVVFSSGVPPWAA